MNKTQLDKTLGTIKNYVDTTSVRRIKKTIDLTNTATYPENKWFPCVTYIPTEGMRMIEVAVHLDSGSKPSWSTHNGGFSCCMRIETLQAGWGTITPCAVCTVYTCSFTTDSINPCGYSQLTNASNAVLWLRGGGKYFVYTDWNATWIPYNKSTNISDQTIEPKTSCPGVSLTRTTLTANLSGNASTATKLATARTISLTGDVTGSASFDGSANASITATVADNSHNHAATNITSGTLSADRLATSGVTAGSYGPSANASPAHAGTFSVPYITVDNKGRVTGASTKTITLPSDNNTDTKVNVTLGTTTKAYLLGTSTTPTSTAAGVTSISDTGVFLTTTAGQLQVTGGLITGSTIRSDTAVTDSLGSGTYPWATIYAKNYGLYPNNSGKGYGNFLVQTVGTTSTTGESRLLVGNNIASGTAENARGYIYLYGTKTGYTRLAGSNNTTSNINILLPSTEGTLALNTVATTSANGLLSSTDKSKLDTVAMNANNYVHPTGAGNRHIPSGGAVGYFLKWSSDGAAAWEALPSASSTGKGIVSLSSAINSSSEIVAATPKAVKTAYDKANHSHPYIPTNGTSNVTVSTPVITFQGGTLHTNMYFGGGMITLKQRDETDYNKRVLQIYSHQQGSLYLGTSDAYTYRIETDMSNGFMFNSKINVPSIQVGSEVYAVNGHLKLGSHTTGSVHCESECCPATDNKYYLGVDILRWKAVYSAGGFIQPSDMRMKSDIRDIDDEIFFNLIKNSGVHSYVLNYPDMPEDITQETAPREQVHVGIIAQEMEQYEGSQYVLNIDSKGQYSVNNYNLTSANMAALKVEISKREAAEERIVVLEKENQELKDRLAKIEAYLGL